jgi:hypothetical protein
MHAMSLAWTLGAFFISNFFGLYSRSYHSRNSEYFTKRLDP